MNVTFRREAVMAALVMTLAADIENAIDPWAPRRMTIKNLAFNFSWMFLAASLSSVADAQHRVLLLDDFDGVVQNRLGGYRNVFERLPSAADAMRVPAASYDRNGYGLQLTADRKAAGFCGYWVQFFDMHAPTHRYLDASDYKFLTFWVRGSIGGEQFTVRLADARQVEKEDSAAVGPIEQFLPRGVTTHWQQVQVPLDGEIGINLKQFAGVTFDFDVPGKATVQIDNLVLKSSRDAKFSGAKLQPPPAVAPAVAADTSRDRALWLWSTERMLDDSSELDALISFCDRQGIEHIWAQLLYQIKTHSGDGVTSCVIERESAFRRFLKVAHQAGIQVHALEGFPEHAQRQYHHISLAIVDAIIAFNEGQPADEQFDGIHFDNEPHLLVGWHDPQRREQILFEFLTLNAECQRRVTATRGKLRFGIDIPFWLQDRDRHSGEATGMVSFNGHRQPASYHLLEMLDNVGVMNYRDTAQGADGMIAHGRDLLAHADRASQAEVFMGVETFPITPSEILFAVGRPREEFAMAVRGSAREMAMRSRLDGYRLRVFDDGQNVHVGIEVGQTDTLVQRVAIANAICKIATAFGCDPNVDAEPAKARQESLQLELSGRNQWTGVKSLSVRNSLTGQTHLLVKAEERVLEKITFADDNARRFSSQTQIAEEYFRKHPAYAGIAIHDYESYRKILEAEPTLRKAARE